MAGPVVARPNSPTPLGGPSLDNALIWSSEIDRINLDATLIYKAPLDYRPTWGVEVDDIEDLSEARPLSDHFNRLAS